MNSYIYMSTDIYGLNGNRYFNGYGYEINHNSSINKLYICFFGGTMILPQNISVILTSDIDQSINCLFNIGLQRNTTEYTKSEIISNLNNTTSINITGQIFSGSYSATISGKSSHIYFIDTNLNYEIRYYRTKNDFDNDLNNIYNNNPQGGIQVYIDDDGTITDSPTIKLTSSFKSQASFSLNGITKKGGAFQYSCKQSYVSEWYPVLFYIKENANIITSVMKNPLVTDIKGVITKKYLLPRYKVFSNDMEYDNWIDDYFESFPSEDYNTDIYEISTVTIDLETTSFSTRYLNKEHTEIIEITADDLVIYGIDNAYYLNSLKSEIMSNQIPFKKYYFNTQDDFNKWKRGDDIFPIPFENIDDSGNPTKNDIPITPDIPTSDVPELNIFTIPTTSWNSFYILELADLTELSQFLWNSDDTIYDSIVKGLALCGNRPLDAIISLRLYPFNISQYAETVEQNLNIGRITVDINTVKRLTKYTPKIHVGSKFIGRYYGDFKDYSPYTSLTLYLPYYGNIELDTNTVMGKTLNIDMIFDIYTGTGTYILSINGNIFKLVDCNIGFDIPITSTDYNAVTSSIFNGIMQTSIGIGSIASGNLLGIGATANGINSLVSAQASGGYQTSARPKSLISLMLCQYPYIIRTYTPYNEPNKYNTQHGYPYNKSNTIANLKGYMEIENANINIDNAADTEINEIRNLLKSGIIYK